MKFPLPISFLGFFCFILIASCKKEDSTSLPEEGGEPPVTHTFTIVKEQANRRDTTVYQLNPDSTIKEIAYTNGVKVFSYQESYISCLLSVDGSQPVETFRWLINSKGDVSAVIKDGHYNYYRYDSAGYFSGNSDYNYTNDSLGLKLIYLYTCSHQYDAQFNHSTIRFKPYPVKLIDEIVNPLTNPFIPSYCGKPYENLIVFRYETYMDYYTYETTSTSYSYALDEHGYVSSLTVSDGTVYHYSYQ